MERLAHGVGDDDGGSIDCSHMGERIVGHGVGKKGARHVAENDTCTAEELGLRFMAEVDTV